MILLTFSPGRRGDLISRLPGGKIVLLERGARLPAGFGADAPWLCEIREPSDGKVAIARPIRLDPVHAPRPDVRGRWTFDLATSAVAGSRDRPDPGEIDGIPVVLDYSQDLTEFHAMHHWRDEWPCVARYEAPTQGRPWPRWVLQLGAPTPEILARRARIVAALSGTAAAATAAWEDAGRTGEVDPWSVAAQWSSDNIPGLYTVVVTVCMGAHTKTLSLGEATRLGWVAIQEWGGDVLMGAGAGGDRIAPNYFLQPGPAWFGLWGGHEEIPREDVLREVGQLDPEIQTVVAAIWAASPDPKVRELASHIGNSRSEISIPGPAAAILRERAP